MGSLTALGGRVILPWVKEGWSSGLEWKITELFFRQTAMSDMSGRLRRTQVIVIDWRNVLSVIYNILSSCWWKASSHFVLYQVTNYTLKSAASVSNALGSVVVSYSICHALLSLAGSFSPPPHLVTFVSLPCSPPPHSPHPPHLLMHIWIRWKRAVAWGGEILHIRDAHRPSLQIHQWGGQMLKGLAFKAQFQFFFISVSCNLFLKQYFLQGGAVGLGLASLWAFGLKKQESVQHYI